MQQTAAQPTAAQQTAAQQTAAQQTAAQMEESVATTLKIASDWKAKGDVRWELSCVGQVLEGLLTIAVTHHDSFEAGVAYLHGKHAEELLARYHALNTTLLNAFFADPKGARAAVDHQVSFAHIGWLLGAVRARRRHPRRSRRTRRSRSTGRSRSSGPSTTGR